MTDGEPKHHKLPSDLEQISTVTKYELLKYLRSRKLFGTIAIIFLIVALIYALPPALGHPYSGHITQHLDVDNMQMMFFYANLTHGDVVEDSIRVSVDGTDVPKANNWNYSSDLNAIVLYSPSLITANMTADYEFREPFDDFSSSFLSFGYLLIIICVTFFGADAIVSEYQTRTAYLLFPNPIRRATMWTGKFIASFIASVLMIGLFYLCIVVLSYGSIGGVAKYLWLSFGFGVLFLLACLSLAYFISSIMKGTTGAIILTFFLLLMILPIIDGVGQIAGIKMWWSLTFAQNTITDSLSYDNYPTDSIINFGRGLTFYDYHPDLGLSVMVMVAYAIVLALISIILFKRRELTG